MAITFLQEKKRQRSLILILALVMVAILIIVWQGFLREGEETLLSPVAPSFSHQKVVIDWQTLKDPKLEELQAFEQILPFGGAIGRENPFIPY